MTRDSSMRIGMGYDVHRLVDGRPLILGGVTIEHDRGLGGHSDADVLTHAVIDALLGAAAQGDIGQHFPDTDAKWKDADSIDMLKAVAKLISDAGYTVVNVDATVSAQAPRLAPYVPLIRGRLAEAIQVGLDRISVKATTTERLGFAGREEGMEARAICLLQQVETKD